MKAVARIHVWWPNIVSDIEETARSCKQCLKTRKVPPSAPVFLGHSLQFLGSVYT